MVAPLLVLVHGTRMSAAQWAPYPALLPEAEVLAPDLPGHGDRLEEEFTTDAAVGVIGEAVAAARPGQPVVLAGHSLGGYMAMGYAARHPDALAALVLIGASAVPTGPGALAYRAFAAVLPRVGHERAARGANWVMRRLGVRGEEAQALPGGAAYRALPAAWQAVMRDCRPELLRELTAPVVLVNGQYDQMRLHVRRFAAQCRRPRVVTLPRVTHLAPLSHPHLVAGVLREVLEGATGRR